MLRLIKKLVHDFKSPFFNAETSISIPETSNEFESGYILLVASLKIWFTQLINKVRQFAMAVLEILSYQSCFSVFDYKLNLDQFYKLLFVYVSPISIFRNNIKCKNIFLKLRTFVITAFPELLAQNKLHKRHGDDLVKMVKRSENW